MSNDFPLVIGTIWLCAGFGLLVLLPARIEPAWRAVGLVLGASVGALAGSFLANTPAGSAAGALIGAGAGIVLAAWRRRLFLQFAAALISAFLAVLCGLVFLERAPFLPLVLIAGAAGAGIAQLREQDTAAAVVAFVGAQLLYQAAYVPVDAWAVIWPEQIAEGVTRAYLGALRPFAIASIGFILLAIVQCRLAGNASRARVDTMLRRVAVRLAAVIVITAVVTTALWLVGIETTRFDLIGMHALAWPVAVATTVLFLMRWPAASGSAAGRDARGPVRARAAARFVALALFGVTILPVSTAALSALWGTGWVPLASFYSAFVGGSTLSVVCKWLFSAAILPALLASAGEAG